ncbi:hypothetical protein AB8Z38_18385 [Bradyrhizobium sp. LLZ17]|uniref:Transposase n=1 Tax=Bradyrhizobium sp. LLZ17 TaxID=3239388 RepID=A0AB39XUZ2_9BRAD
MALFTINYLGKKNTVQVDHRRAVLQKCWRSALAKLVLMAINIPRNGGKRKEFRSGPGTRKGKSTSGPHSTCLISTGGTCEADVFVEMLEEAVTGLASE